MSDKPEGKDGAERVFARMKKEFKQWRRRNEVHIKRWKKKPWDVHAFTNVWVEGCRFPDVAYWNGHVLTYSIALNFILLGIVTLVMVGG